MLSVPVAPQKRYIRYLPTIGGFALEVQSAIFAAARIYYMPLIVNFKVEIDRLGCIHGAVAAGNFYLALYNSLNEAPNSRIVVSNNTGSNGINQKQQVTITPSKLILMPNLYFLGLEADNTNDIYWQNITNNALIAIRNPQNINNGPSYYVEDLPTYSVPPATATPVFDSGIVPDVARMYLAWVRVSRSLG